MDNINKIDERIRQKLLYETYKDMQCPVCGYYCLGICMALGVLLIIICNFAQGVKP